LFHLPEGGLFRISRVSLVRGKDGQKIGFSQSWSTETSAAPIRDVKAGGGEKASGREDDPKALPEWHATWIFPVRKSQRFAKSRTVVLLTFPAVLVRSAPEFSWPKKEERKHMLGHGYGVFSGLKETTTPERETEGCRAVTPAPALPMILRFFALFTRAGDFVWLRMIRRRLPPPAQFETFSRGSDQATSHFFEGFDPAPGYVFGNEDLARAGMVNRPS
jgi:hypothetical protein